MEIAASQQTGSWEWKQVEGTEIKDPRYIMATCASVAMFKSAHFDVCICVVNGSSTLGKVIQKKYALLLLLLYICNALLCYYGATKGTLRWKQNGMGSQFII